MNSSILVRCKMKIRTKIKMETKTKMKRRTSGNAFTRTSGNAQGTRPKNFWRHPLVMPTVESVPTRTSSLNQIAIDEMGCGGDFVLLSCKNPFFLMRLMNLIPV